MRILELNPYYSPQRGGVDRRVAGMSRALAARGHDVEAVVGRVKGAPAESTEGRVHTRRFEPSMYESTSYDPPFLSPQGFAKAFEGPAPDLVDIHYMWTPDYTRSVRKYAGKAPIVYTLHNSFGWGEGVEGRAAYISDSVLKLFALNCDLAVCISDFVKRDVGARGLPAEKLTVVPHGIDPTPDADLAALKAAPGRHPRPYAVFAGRLERTKGLNVLVEAVREVKSKVDFVIYGHGPDLKPLEEEAHDFGVRDRFHFEGYKPEAEVRQAMAQADLFVYPATFEPFGLAVLEALDLGCPVIATSVGGLPGLCGHAARLVMPGDSSALARAIDELLYAGDARERLSQIGRERAKEFTWERIGKKQEVAFELAIDRHR